MGLGADWLRDLCDPKTSVLVAVGLILRKSVGGGVQLHQAIGERGGELGFQIIRVEGCGVSYQLRHHDTSPLSP
jgi:hypothetical protein